jgi:hypothetical protein
VSDIVPLKKKKVGCDNPMLYSLERIMIEHTMFTVKRFMFN